jgi:lariat debranching enzyme
VNGIRIAGASGIYKAHDFAKGMYAIYSYLTIALTNRSVGNHEMVPYSSSSMRSIYHIREYCVRKLSLVRCSSNSRIPLYQSLLQLSSPQIFLSHDWPKSIEHFGDLPGLLRRKKFLRSDVESGTLGSPPLMGLLNTLKPAWWFSAHLHARFEATVVHVDQPNPPTQSAPIQNPDEIIIEDDDLEDSSSRNQETVQQSVLTSQSMGDIPRNPDEITLDDEEENVVVPPPPPPPPLMTRFLALDKCLPKRQFLEVLSRIYQSYLN